MKFLIFLLGYCIYPFSFLIPRSKKKFAFGSYGGAFNDNAKYLFIHVANKYPEIDTVWISENRKTVRHINRLGLKAYYIGSLRGLWHALRSRYWFVNSYTSDILFFASGNAICINLWHGVGLKKIEFCIRSGKLADRYVKKTFKQRFYHPESYRRPDYFVSSTDFQSVKFAEAFRIPLSRCLNIGYPRNTILTATEEERTQFIGRYESEATRELIDSLRPYRKVFIYMPTWRDSQEDVFSSHIDLPALNRIMQEQNDLLVLKPHPNTKVDKEGLSRYDHILLLDNRIDIYTFLPYTDVLITDYSSILYDYILMDRKDVILYLYDMEEYINNRDFNYPFRENIAGKMVSDFNSLYECIRNNDFQIEETQKEAIKAKFWGAGKDIPVCQEILNRTVFNEGNA